jgi:hypothetical protein
MRAKAHDLSKAQKSALLAALLQQKKTDISPMQLNPHPVDDAPRPNRMTKSELLAESYRKRRGDALLTLLTLAKSPLGQSR